MGSLHASQKWSLTWKKIFFVVNHQNIGCKLLPKEEKIWKFETWPFTHYQTRSGILKHCVIAQPIKLKAFSVLFFSKSILICRKYPLENQSRSFGSSHQSFHEPIQPRKYSQWFEHIQKPRAFRRTHYGRVH